MEYVLKATWTHTEVIKADDASRAVQFMLDVPMYPGFTRELDLEMVEILEERP